MKRLLAITLTALLATCLGTFAQEYVPTPVTISKEKVKLSGKVYLSHVVLEKQTLYSIAKAYGVSEEELYEANPKLKETGLQKNAILLIPYNENVGKVEAPQTEPGGQNFIEHTVRWYEDIDDIAQNYNVTVKEIMDLNGLKSRKLKSRQVLKIPVKAVAVQAPAEDVQTPEEDNIVIADDTEAAAPDTTFLTIRPRESVDFSLVLPLNASGQVSEFNMDFYSGVLMALKDLENEELKVNMHVWDLSAGLPATEALCRSDFILGPIASRDIEAVLQRVEGRVPVISPLDQKAASLSNYYQNFIQAPTATESQWEDLGAWVKEDMEEGDRLILITEKGASSVSAPVAIRSSMAKQELVYEILSYAIVEGRGIPAILTEKMDKNATNRIVVATESEAFMGDVIRNLGIMLGRGYDIVMYAPSKVRTFDTIEGSIYHDAQLHISSSYFVDYSDPDVERFVREYRALYNTEPSQFAFQGYDTARFFVLRCARYDYGWTQRLGWERGKGLHTDFFFGPSASGNSQNVAVRRIVYRKDYTTKLER